MQWHRLQWSRCYNGMDATLELLLKWNGAVATIYNASDAAMFPGLNARVHIGCCRGLSLRHVSRAAAAAGETSSFSI